MFVLTNVKVRNGESLEQALRRFNREVQKDGVLKELRDREHYKKPSQVKAIKLKEKARKIALSKRSRR